ncbi:MAG: glycosyltransferase family 39 protein [Chloroflexota bacterium]|nr:glycosyltransferase family 39 protein [Chloroflexota bacterium]
MRLPDYVTKRLNSYPTLRWWWGIVFLLLLAYAPRVWVLAYSDLTFDEVATVYVAHRPPGDIIRYVMGAVREHPPLYYLGISLWFKLAGITEFAVRYPSTLISILGVAWGVRLGKEWLNQEGGWWTGLLLAIMPFSIWAGRNARMYSLVLLLSLLIVESWRCWIKNPDWKHGVCFLLLSLAGALTHYYLLLLWAVEGVHLLLMPQSTRRLRVPWLSVVATSAAAVGLSIAISPGIRATFAEVTNRFPLHAIRITELKALVMDLYLYWHYHTLWPVALAGLTATGWGWWLTWRRSRLAGTLVMLWGCLPLMIANFIPAALEARYLLPAFPALVLGLAALLTFLRPHLLRLAFALLIIFEIGLRWERLFLPPDTTFSTQMTHLQYEAQSGDALIFNGPWPSLLLTYYQAPAETLTSYHVPQAAPPGFSADVDIPRLEQILATHDCLWVSYGAVKPADPQYAVSRWLAENSYNVARIHNLALYLPPVTPLETSVTNVSFGEKLHLHEASLDRHHVQPTEYLRVRLHWAGPHLSWRFRTGLALIGPQGHIWARRWFSMGPLFRDDGEFLPQDWIARRGLRIPLGTPPGDYQLALQVTGNDVTDPPATGWWPIQEITVLPRRIPTAESRRQLYLPLIFKNMRELTVPPATATHHRLNLPQWASVEATFGQTLTLAGLQPADDQFVPGYPLNCTFWWQAERADPKAEMSLRLIGKRTPPSETYSLAPPFYPLSEWVSGDVVRQDISYLLPRELSGGTYHLQIQLSDEQGVPLPVTGSRQSLTFWEYLTTGKQVTLADDWADLLIIHVTEPDRNYHPPLFRRHADARFGDTLRLRGYHIGKDKLQAGESTELIEYWEALQTPERIYAVFNHLLLPGSTNVIWQEDSWPQAGAYTTNRWVAGEVVEEKYLLRIPEETQPGNYTFYVGSYNPKNPATRLPAFAANGERYLNDEVPLLTIEVTPD